MRTANSYILSMHSQVLLYQDHQTPFSIRLKLKHLYKLVITKGYQVQAATIGGPKAFAPMRYFA